MLKIIAILILIYIAGGIYRIVSDFRQPLINKPDYVRNPRLSLFLFIMIMWFPLLIMDIKQIGIKRLWKQNRRTARLAKLERKTKKLERQFKQGKF